MHYNDVSYTPIYWQDICACKSITGVEAALGKYAVPCIVRIYIYIYILVHCTSL